MSLRAFPLSIFLVFFGLRLCEYFESGESFLCGDSIALLDLVLSDLRNCAILVYCYSLNDLTLLNSRLMSSRVLSLSSRMGSKGA